jgi:diguanylate cyclase (GGDEF)-like protein
VNIAARRGPVSGHTTEPTIDVPSALSPLAEATVMMVDDEAAMTELVQDLLEEGGYTRFVSTNAPQQTIDLMRETLPGLLLLDLMMPGVSGFDILEQVRADPVLRYTPVIVLMELGDSAHKLRALELGATEFLAKPLDPSELLLRVRNTLAFRRHQERLANHDPVTGLANRHAFARRLGSVLERAAGGTMGLLLIEVEEVRQVRETLGHQAADRLLASAALRIARSVRHGDVTARFADARLDADGVARMEGDNFAVLLPALASAEQAARVARRVLDDLQQPMDAGDHQVFATANIGIAIFPNDAQTADALIKSADLATTQARTQGRGRYAFFSPELNERSYERLTLGNQLHRAIERDELQLHYQPKLDLASGRVVGAEALIRWMHPEHGMLLPGRFIPIAEDSGLIADIGDWVVRTACSECAGWSRQGHSELTVAVNVSKSQFERRRFFDVVRSALETSGLAASQLVVEITESVLMDHADNALALLQQIKSLGVRLSIDDFGTGYSSLSYLKRFPVDELKIDRAFIADLPGGKQDLAIVRTVAALGHNLGMTVLAEGVETPAQLKAVKAAGCDSYQGYLLSPAVPSRDFMRLLRGRAVATRSEVLRQD